MRHEVLTDLVRGTYSRKKVLPGFLPSRERDESTALFRDMKKKSREEAEDRDFSLIYPRKAFQ